MKALQLVSNNSIKSFFVASVFSLTLVLGVLPAPKAGAAIAHEESISANGAITSSVTTGTIQGGTDMFYIVSVANRSNVGVSTVSGGSLTWTERVDQCAGRNQQGLSIWTAFGSPSSFTVSITLDSSSNGIAVAVSRYSGVDSTTPVEDVVYHNTNGESGACSGGTDGDTTSLTTGSTTADSIHYAVTNSRQRTISTADADYTQRATDNGGTGGDTTTIYAHEYLKTATGDDTASHTLNDTTDWIMAGFVIKPAAAFSPVLTQAQYRWYVNTNGLTPSVANAAENSAGIINNVTTVIRLRLGISLSDAALSASSRSFKLQYGTSTSGPWTDVGAIADADWYNSNWQYRKKISIDNTKVSGSGSHANLPVLVNITDSDLSADAQTDGDDILFTTSNGTTKINHEIESYTSGSGALRSWVKVPSVSTSADTDIYMYYGNAGVGNQENVSGTWSDYSLVWHMSEDPSGSAPQTLDSTGNAFHGTTNGSMTSGDLVSGKIGNAYDFDGSNDYVSRSDPTGDELDMLSGESLTYSMWVKSGDTLDFDIYTKGSAPGYRLIKRADGTVICQFRDGTINLNPDTTTSIEDNTWRYIVCQHDGSSDTASVHLNGSQEDSVTDASFGASSNGSDLELPTSGTTRVIEIDELRVSKTTHSTDRILTEYNNQNSPSTFYSVGTEEVASGSGTEEWLYYDNATPTDGATIPSVLLSSSDTTQSYLESKPSPNNPNTISIGDQGEWDFSIVPGDGVELETVYYFRLVETDNTALDTYTVYPELCLDTVPATGSRMLHGGWFSDNQKQGYNLDDQTVNVCGS